jgi:Bacterial type II and III secretion system protein/Bacterial type II/III secretion system short domain
MTRFWKAMLVGILAISSLAMPAAAQVTGASQLPADAKYDRKITVDLPPLELEMYLQTLGTSVGLQVIGSNLPNAQVSLKFKDLPFRQVWNNVIAIYGLDFILQSNDLVIVGPREAIAALKPPVAAPPTPPAPTPPAPIIRTYTIKGDIAAIRTLIETQFPGIKLAVVGNRLVVTASADDQTKISALINDVDVAPPPPPAPPAAVPSRTETVALSYAKAAKLAEVLQKVVAGSTPTSATSATATTLPNTTTSASLQGVTVTAEESSNTLIISGPSSAVDSLLKIIPSLDRPQQLVNVGVRIQEVSDEAGRNLGIDWSFGVGNFGGSIVGGALNFVLDATRSLAGLNIGAALNALETQRLSKRVNDSTLTVLNNGTGAVKVGGRIEITSQSTGDNQQGLASRTLNFGVEIQVSPSIAADGNITLETSAQVSSVLNPNSTDFQRIDFVDRTARSTVRLRDGQTLLLGSLLQTVEDSTSKGLPYLSSIPLIGDVFKTTSSSSNQTQIIIVVTVNVIK